MQASRGKIIRDGKKGTTLLTIRLSPHIKAALEKLAAADRRPVSQYVALLTEDHVKAKQPGL